MVLTSPAGEDALGNARRAGRERVLEEAAALFVRQGYRETTLRDIAAAAGMKAGSIYYHFDSKDDLLAAVLDTGIERITRSFHETAAALPEDLEPRQRLCWHVLGHLEALFEHGPFTTSHVTAFHGAPEAVRQLGVPSRDAYERLWADLLRGFADAGQLRPDVDLGLQRILLLSAANSTLDWFDPSGGVGLAELAAALTDQFWHGVSQPGTAG
jgi:AcrR family transcriptional regulator